MGVVLLLRKFPCGASTHGTEAGEILRSAQNDTPGAAQSRCHSEERSDEESLLIRCPNGEPGEILRCLRLSLPFDSRSGSRAKVEGRAVSMPNGAQNDTSARLSPGVILRSVATKNAS